MPKPLISILIITFLSLISEVSYAETDAGQKPQKPSISVIAYKVEIDKLPQSLEVLASLQSKQSVDLRSQLSERITAIHFEDGQTVQKGQLLVELNNRQTLAELQKAKAVEQEALRQYRRANQLKGRGNITQSVIDERYSTWQVAIAERNLIEADLNERSILAPFSGHLGFKQVTVGTLLTPTTTIVTLDSTDQMYLDMAAPAAYVGQVALNQEVEVRHAAFPQKVFKGHVIAIAPRLNESSALLQVRALLENPLGELKGNMQVNAKLLLPTKLLISIPTTALLMLGERNFVYRLQESDKGVKVERIEVQVGRRYTDRIEVLSGLKAGDSVVSQGIMRLMSGKNVSVKAYQNHAPLADLIRAKARNANGN
ncbi:efflux RND transporter periplasmic adaptor subunit [Thiomicrorhabdus heinhorstiae]|uniref:Efflux RND transporter periplasmic adaptor subunit n=1 Tax=Thiomicrorhabdus heinhorstiae TaxID=2748010 RepID=A0ABS0C3N0_9GAMM|nr:efflux RND transporter periplasmic adaptor subunit [Thiomicrorhabdus heinhorstiae]MBF6058741.1 efflux RND transporter periplasmic adaptor subunit [Thiomicrorhabdus heinhorstiae]